MKKLLLFTIFFMGLLGIVYVYKDEISNFLYEQIILDSVEMSTPTPNEYYREKNYNYVQITDDFFAKDKQHLMNIYYTIVNTGMDTFTFMCDRSYTSCTDDVAEISHNQTLLSNINSFVHPFNGFSSLETQYDSLGKVTIKVNKSYTEQEIKLIKEKMDTIISTQVGNKTNPREIIKAIHDYIIKTTRYDSDRSDKKIVNYKSDIAYGPLFQGYGLCGGYTDAMALFLDYYNIPNFKVISENHIWNAVYVENKWYHLDLTWDDPVSSNGRDILEYTFFLISSKELEEIEKEQHIYDKNVFFELDNIKNT